MYDDSDLAALAVAAKAGCREYLERCEFMYSMRTHQRKAASLGVVSFVGFGRAGKDESARLLVECLLERNDCSSWPTLTRNNVKYGGSTSSAVAPLVAFAVGKPVDVVFAERHEHRKFWKDFCDELRRDDPTLIARMLLGQSDVLAGLRDIKEVKAVREQGVAAVHVWVSRPGVTEDTTVAFSQDDCDLVLHNNGSLEDLKRKISGLAALIFPYKFN